MPLEAVVNVCVTAPLAGQPQLIKFASAARLGVDIEAVGAVAVVSGGVVLGGGGVVLDAGGVVVDAAPDAAAAAAPAPAAVDVELPGSPRGTGVAVAPDEAGGGALATALPPAESLSTWPTLN
ncbi:hypothetical protein GCM10027288_49010 [Bordetella tumbae]